ncbi:hypothetical protein HHI36_017185 [Cryptolaemus montrouzieri]|uniref:Uncharacterized protein n=1 Tax=Cryptolaemus montrouzieri TaxID=559131 RepID=A0ABD2NMC0_9CUCU
MLIVFFDPPRICAPRVTVNAAYYVKVLERLKRQIPSINYTPYTPDLAPADFFLLPKLKMQLKGLFCEDVPSIQEVVPESLRITSEALKGMCVISR